MAANAQLVDLLVQNDETTIADSMRDAIAERAKKKGTNKKGEDIVEALTKAGILSTEKFWLKSTKMWAAVAALVILLFDYLGGGIQPNEPDGGLWKVAAAPLAYIFGQGLADFGKNKPTAA